MTITAILKFAWEIIRFFLERNKKKKEERGKALSTVKKGLASRNRGTITRGFNRLKRVK